MPVLGLFNAISPLNPDRSIGVVQILQRMPFPRESSLTCAQVHFTLPLVRSSIHPSTAVIPQFSF